MCEVEEGEAWLSLGGTTGPGTILELGLEVCTWNPSILAVEAGGLKIQTGLHETQLQPGLHVTMSPKKVIYLFVHLEFQNLGPWVYKIHLPNAMEYLGVEVHLLDPSY